MDKTTRAFIGLGSNLGDRQKNCEGAVAWLKAHPQIEIARIAKWIETEAVCLPGETQPDFINGAVQIRTNLDPVSLYQTCKAIEKKIGRPESLKKWGPRIIDLDLLFYGDQIIETPFLKIPHPLAHERLFVLEPLNEIAPDLVHPILKKGVAELFQNLLNNLPIR